MRHIPNTHASGDLFQKAVDRFRQGDLEQARGLCEKLLRTQPSNVQTLQLYGTVLYFGKTLDQAATVLQKAVKLHDNSPETHNTLGCVYKDSNSAELAEQHLKHALALRPNYAAAMLNLSILYIQTKRLAEAIESLKTLVGQEPQHAKANYLLGQCFLDGGLLQNAIHHFRICWSLSPQDIDLSAKLASLYLHQRMFNDARNVLEQSSRYAPQAFPLLLQWGNLHLEEGRLDEAEHLYKRLLKENDNSEILLNNLGVIAEKREQYEQANDYYLRSLAIKPESTLTLVNLGRVAWRKNEYRAGRQWCEKALQLAPNDVGAKLCLANITESESDISGAEQILRTLIEQDGDNFKAWYNLGNLLQRRGDLVHAAQCYRATSRLNPTYADASLNLGIALLTMGQFEEGWHHYFHRLRFPPDGICLSPIGQQASYTGKKILLLRAQGIGDEILFLRYATLLAEQGATLTYCPNKKLRAIIERLPFIDSVQDENNPDQRGHDFTFMVDDLPLITGCTSKDDMPSPITFQPLPDKIVQIKHRLLPYQDGKPIVGLTWRAGARKANTGFENARVLSKQIELEKFAAMVHGLDAHFLILQRDVETQELSTLAELLTVPVHDFSDLNDDLEGMIALLAQLDDYIGVSNTNMHLMTAIGGSAQVLVLFPPDWRWMYSGDSTPWCPGFHILRQSPEGEWPALFPLGHKH
ncbi:MAG: tetratricopeptide repeat protein [Gammaproteobacteria bacterium]|nr:tetratricopeptide repeat protein [Gammaproteobacteria bacterium]